jgi:outer membrane lipoprotein carrier protein
MFHSITKFFSFLILCCYFSSSYADPASDQLLQLLNTIHTLQADFTQVVTDAKGRTLNRAEGQMSLQRPGKFRWNVQHPNAQLIVTNGKKIWIYEPDLEQLTIRYLGKEAGETPALLLSNTNETLTKDFSVQTVNSADMQWFLLKPKDKGSMFEKIKLGFVKQEIRQMQLQDHLGHTTVIQLNRIVMNSTLSPSLFNFKASGKVDVIDETKK